MEDIYLIHTFDPITTHKSIYKMKRGDTIQSNILQNSNYSNILFQLYTRIINFMKKNN